MPLSLGRRVRFVRLVLIAILLASAAPVIAEDAIYFVADSALYRVESGDQPATRVGAVGQSVSAIAGSPGGQLYGVDSLTDQLFEIDPATGASTIIGGFGRDLIISAIAFDNAGRLWALGCASVGPDCGTDLFELDPTTGAFIAFRTVIDSPFVFWMTIIQDVFYVGGPFLGFGSLDTVTGDVTPIRTEIRFARDVTGAAASDDGTLWLGIVGARQGPANPLPLPWDIARFDPQSGAMLELSGSAEMPLFRGDVMGPAVIPTTAGIIDVQVPVWSDRPTIIDVTYPRNWCFESAETTVLDGRIDILARETCGCLGGPGPGVFQVSVGPLLVGDFTIALTRQGFDGSGGTCDAPQQIGLRPIAVETPLGITAVEIDPPTPFAGEEVDLLVTLSCHALSEVRSVADRLVWLQTVIPPTGLPCFGLVVDRHPLGPLPAGEHTVVIRSLGGDVETFEGIARFTVGDPGSETVVLAGRYEVGADWIRPGGLGDDARGRLIEGSDIGAEFYFANPANPELLVKMLDGCTINGHRWFFAGGLTNLGVDLKVRDLETGAERLYNSEVGDDFAPILDTQAFACE